MSEVLVEVTRGPLVESIHRGDVVAVDTAGKIIARVGDPDKVTFLRSSAKPLQALTVVLSGALEHFGLTETELAIMCASHSAEDEHVDTVLGILHKLGLGEEHLQCGSHAPLHQPSAVKLFAAGRRPSAVHSNCSGKHSGMLAVCVHKGYPLASYTDPDHPVQVENRKMLAEMAGIDPSDVLIGVDGCGVPVFGMSLRHMARAWARLADPSGLRPELAAAARRVAAAMQKNPTKIAGTGRVTTDLLARTHGQIVAKSGAEGVYTVGWLSKGYGLALKVEDGNTRATGPAAIEALRQLGALTAEEMSALSEHHRGAIRNYRGDIVGEIRPAFRLI